MSEPEITERGRRAAKLLQLPPEEGQAFVNEADKTMARVRAQGPEEEWRVAEYEDCIHLLDANGTALMESANSIHHLRLLNTVASAHNSALSSLREKIKALEKALEFYADKKYWFLFDLETGDRQGPCMGFDRGDDKPWLTAVEALTGVEIKALEEKEAISDSDAQGQNCTSSNPLREAKEFASVADKLFQAEDEIRIMKLTEARELAQFKNLVAKHEGRFRKILSAAGYGENYREDQIQIGRIIELCHEGVRG